MNADFPGTVGPLVDPTPATWTQVATKAQIDHQLGETRAAPFRLAVKANVAVRGFRRSAACKVFDTNAEAADAQVVAQLRRVGGVVVGTTNMHELAFGITSANASYGPVRLPGHPDRSAGGSSGGSAAAVASGEVEVALGTDTGGSVSIPSSHCGVTGFRPSTGRWSTAGILGLSTTRDTPGIFARTVSEIMRIDDFITGGGVSRIEVPSTTFKVGLPVQLLEDLHTDTRSAFDAVLDQLPHEIEAVEVDFDEVLALTEAAETPLVMWEARRSLGEAAGRALNLPSEAAFERLAAEVRSSDVRAILQTELNAPVSPEAYAAAQRHTELARETWVRLRDSLKLDALLFPTTPAPAPLLTAGDTVEHLGRRIPIFDLYTRNTGQGTVLGAPMVTIPAPVAKRGLPIGMTVQGHRFDDRRALVLAHRIEAALALGE